MAKKPFKGKISLDVRDSVPDWEPYTPVKAPEGAPNVLFVLYDDTGLAAWSPFGGRINMPSDAWDNPLGDSEIYQGLIGAYTKE